jgi:hypothetical protein
MPRAARSTLPGAGLWEFSKICEIFVTVKFYLPLKEGDRYGTLAARTSISCSFPQTRRPVLPVAIRYVSCLSSRSLSRRSHHARLCIVGKLVYLAVGDSCDRHRDGGLRLATTAVAYQAATPGVRRSGVDSRQTGTVAMSLQQPFSKGVATYPQVQFTQPCFVQTPQASSKACFNA